MRSNYKRLGDFIRKIDNKNKDLSVSKLMGINIDKFFMPSVANVIGTDMSKYRIVKKGHFACNRMHVGRDKRLPIALLKQEEIIVSPAYDVFEIIDTNVLYPDFLMMWFMRREFDRNVWFYTDADVRGGLKWDDFCNIQLPVPSIDIQKEIVKEYNVLEDRIKINKGFIKKMEETTQAIYKQWFVDFEFPNKIGTPYKSSGSDMEFNSIMAKEIPKGWQVSTIGDVLVPKGYIRGPFGSALKKNEMVKEGIPVYEQQHAIDNHRNFRYFVSEEKYKSLKRFAVKPDDFVISCSGTLGKVTVISEDDPIGIINQALLILRVEPNKLNPICFKYFITSSEGNNKLIANAGGSAQVNIAKREEIESIPVVIPDAEQEKKVSEYLNICDEVINHKIKENKLLERTKEILLSKMPTIGG
jgi:type I restriction enzyme, S subunit